MYKKYVTATYFLVIAILKIYIKAIIPHAVHRKAFFGIN